MKKNCQLLLLFILYILPYTLDIHSALATEPSQVGSPSANIQLKIKALQDEIASKATLLKLEIGRKLQNKVLAGSIQFKTTTSLTLNTPRGPKVVNLNNYTLYQGPMKSNLKTLSLDDFVVALGDIDDNGVLTAKKIVKLSSPPLETKETLLGQVIATYDQLLTIQTQDRQIFSFSLSPTTVYKSAKNQPLTLNQIQTAQTVLVVGKNEPSGIIKARSVYLLSSSSAQLKP